MGTDSIREAGRATQGVRLLSLDAGDKVAAAVVIPDDEKEDTTGTLLQ
jgi:DNA gyrase subunit A